VPLGGVGFVSIPPPQYGYSGRTVNRYVWFILALNLLVLIPILVFARMRSSRVRPDAWEYRVEDISDTSFGDRLNVLGRQGWELVSARHVEEASASPVGYEVVMKRPLGR